MPEHLRVEGNLQDRLFERGVEFPCGGTALCGGCRVRVLSGDIPITPEMEEVLSPQELAAGWRLACRTFTTAPVELEVGQWDAHVLGDSTVLAAEPESQTGYGVAIDLGTTTLVAQLVDLASGEVLDVQTGVNPQARYGADLMTRIGFEAREPGRLTRLIREELERMVALTRAGRPLREILICGNTVMHHLFCGLSVEPLAAVPFETPDGGERELDLGWGAPIRFLPCLGSFVGSDVLAGMVAVELKASEALIDLGTNGEIVVGTVDGFACASAAAGPAFEAGRIRMGMRAANGAIDRFNRAGRPHVLGGGKPRGLCGSGLVDAIALGLDSGVLKTNGRFSDGGKQWAIAPPVTLYQSDIREMQLAKGAIAAGLRMLAGPQPSITKLYLAGAFGNYVTLTSARRIGLVPEWAGVVEPAGNTALRGTRLLLTSPGRRAELLNQYLRRTRHVSLAADAQFQEIFGESMGFPEEAART